MKKILKIIIVSMVIVLLLLASGLFYFSIRHHHSAHEEVVAYLNKQFEGKVTFRDFSLSYLRRFPKLHVELMDVSVLEEEEEILKIGDLDLMLNLRSIWKKELKIDRVVLNDVTFFAVTDSLGRQPRLLASKSPSADSAHQALIINARRIEVR
ncbi:MAG: AsmA family protein, partial [Bacteroidales bacterium]|nr:AsmA family protein [Bacteroidales bacterium]